MGKSDFQCNSFITGEQILENLKLLKLSVIQFETYYTVHDTYDAGESVATRNVQELAVQMSNVTSRL